MRAACFCDDPNPEEGKHGGFPLCSRPLVGGVGARCVVEEVDDAGNSQGHDILVHDDGFVGRTRTWPLCLLIIVRTQSLLRGGTNQGYLSA